VLLFKRGWEVLEGVEVRVLRERVGLEQRGNRVPGPK